MPKGCTPTKESGAAAKKKPADACDKDKEKCPLEKKKARVVKITAKVPGTRGKRKATDKRADDVLKSSTSKDESLSSNKPAILVRGCNDVELAAETSPADQPVKWEVKPNENSEAAPTITPQDGGKKAKLKTNKAGSFSVIATLDDSKVVWNVVFVWVKVDPATSVITGRNTKFADGGSSGGWTVFKSGEFTAGSYAWEGKVKMKVLGGGTNKKLGVGKVKIHILQNGITDTLTGHYKDGGTALEQPKGGLPVLDATNSTSPFIWLASAGKVTPANSSISDSSKDREAWSGDSPAGAFQSSHKNTAKALERISGLNEFETAVAAVSDDAKNSIVVHAKTKWSADYAGTVDGTGKYTPSGAKVTKESKFSLISSATGGQDAYQAGFETFAPRFNGGVDTVWSP